MIKNEERREKMTKEYEDRKIEPINIEALIKASSESMLAELAVACKKQNVKDTQNCQNRKRDQSK